MGTFDELREEARRANVPDDTAFTRASLPYLFELRVPAEISHASLIFPLPLNPMEYRLSEPYAAEVGFAEGGSAWAEENGIVVRDLYLSGHTGWAPKVYRGSDFYHLPKQPKPSFSRLRARAAPAAGLAVSGQRWFEYLQDALFRTYGDLRKDPHFADGTSMIFHNLKDDEHWLIIPREFRLRRTAAREALVYVYEIEAWAVAPATALVKLEPPEDKSTLDKLRDGVRTVQSAIRKATGAIREIQALAGEIRSFVQSVGNIVRDATSMIDAARGVVEGTSAVITKPFSEVEGIARDLTRALQQFQDGVDDGLWAIDAMPDRVKQSFRDLGDALDELGVHPDLFAQESAARAGAETLSSALTSSSRRSALEAAAAEGAPTTFEQVTRAGTKPRFGDLARADAEGASPRAPTYRSAYRRRLGRLDTLESLALRYLGSGSLWREIATLNGLRSPYLSEQRLPGTLGSGDEILIPSTEPAPADLPQVPVLGVDPAAPLEERLLGRDFRLARDANTGLYDWAVDGATQADFQTVVGVPNLAQAIEQRCRYLRGDYPVSPSVGLRIVEGPDASATYELLRYRVAETVLAEPRIVRIQAVTLNEGASADTIDADVDAEVIGLSERGATTFEVR